MSFCNAVVVVVLQHDHKRSVFVGNLSFGEFLFRVHVDVKCNFGSSCVEVNL